MSDRSVIVKKGSYRDSITLMKISNEVAVLKGIKQAAAAMATPLNKRLLKDIGFQSKEIQGAGPEDMIVAVEGEDASSVSAGLQTIEELLAAKESGSHEDRAVLPTTLEEAIQQMPDANLALISVPGEFAAREASKALDKGLNVFLFSSNVPVDKEVELKQRAIRRGLMVMGPDCGTAIVNRVVLGFGNVVNKGSIGLVSASGTGLQQVSTLIDEAGLGISQALGTGGRDLSDEVGAATTIQSLGLLASDPDTKTIVVISKPPAGKTMGKVLEEAGRIPKPVVINFLGKTPFAPPPNCTVASTLEAAALSAVSLSSGGSGLSLTLSRARKEARESALKESASLSASQRYVRGLYSGGTLCYEAQVVMGPLLGQIASNVPLGGSSVLKDANRSVKHSCVDLGAEEFVVGRAHPMMDYTVRKLRILQEARDPETAVILLDVVLGYGSNPDPAGQLIPTIKDALSIATKAKRHLCFVASLVGTAGDPQGLKDQSRRLTEAGVLLLPSNAEAALLSALIATRGKEAEPPEPGTEAAKPSRKQTIRPSFKTGKKNGLLGKTLKVINLGVGTFADDLKAQKADVLTVDWKPPAGGDVEVMDLLDKLR